MFERTRTSVRSFSRVAFLALAVCLGALSCDRNERTALESGDPLHAEAPPMPPVELGLPPSQMVEPNQGKEEYSVPPPPFSEGVFPCSECHKDVEPNPVRRVLVDAHDDIALEHDEQHRWCLDCHDLKDKDKLRLASGVLVPFEESHRLCGQCHGDKYRDWKAGVHGKRTGMWDGRKEYLLCAHCHNPHSPRFKPLAPDPPPERPENIR